MFLIRFRYVYILLLSLYSYINIRVTVGTKLFDFELNGAYLFAVLSIVIAGVWELNRLVDISQQHRTLRVHPLILLFLASMLNVVLISTLALLGAVKNNTKE